MGGEPGKDSPRSLDNFILCPLSLFGLPLSSRDDDLKELARNPSHTVSIEMASMTLAKIKGRGDRF